jgi:hypothetical protein
MTRVVRATYRHARGTHSFLTSTIDGRKLQPSDRRLVEPHSPSTCSAEDTTGTVAGANGTNILRLSIRSHHTNCVDLKTLKTKQRLKKRGGGGYSEKFAALQIAGQCPLVHRYRQVQKGVDGRRTVTVWSRGNGAAGGRAGYDDTLIAN